MLVSYDCDTRIRTSSNLGRSADRTDIQFILRSDKISGKFSAEKKAEVVSFENLGAN